MPWTVAHPAAPGGKAPGQHGGWLGKGFDPFRVEGDPNAPGFQVGGLGLARGGRRPTGSAAAVRCSPRSARSCDLARGRPRAWDGFQARALDALASAEARGAFRVDREDPRLRDRYGRHIHGQCLLLARRLVEAGVGLVTVNWHNDGQNFWDTHGDNFNHLKNRLMPPADQGFAALLDDLSTRVACSTRRSWSGSASSAAAADHQGQRRPRALAALLLGRAGRRRHPRRPASTARATAGPPTPPATPSAPTTSAPRSCTPWGSTPPREVRDPLGRPLRINSGAPLHALFT